MDTPQSIVNTNEPKVPVKRIGKFAASKIILFASMKLLRQDKEILIFPVLSIITTLVTLALFIVGYLLIFSGANMEAFSTMFDGEAPIMNSGGEILFWFVFYLTVTFITTFFEAGIITIAHARLNGGNYTFMDGVRVALSRADKIFVWSLINATVGVVLRALAERSKLLGKIVTGFFGMFWSLVTYFIIPVLMFEEKGISDSIARSGEVFKQKWGESVVVNVGIGFIMFLLILLGLILTVGVLIVSGGSLLIPAVFVFVVFVMVLIPISSALSTIFKVVLYEYATHGTLPAEFPSEVIQSAFAHKK